MKQLTKEQHEEIMAWMQRKIKDGFLWSLPSHFEADFIPACCDSCADGEECDSKHYEEHPERKPDHILNLLPSYGWPIDAKPYVSIDRKPEETASEYMDRVATINGRK